jgi:signal transduction histidine kinase
MSDHFDPDSSGSARANGQYGGTEERLAVERAMAAGVTIDNARMHQESEQRHRWLAASIAVTQQLLAGQDGDRLDSIPRTAQQTASADFATLALVIEPERLQVKAACGVLTEDVLGLILDMESSTAGQVARSKEPVLTADDRDAHGVDRPVPMGSVIVVPLLADNRALGTLSVGRLAVRRPFTAGDVEHIAGFAGHAGVAMELDRARSDRQQRSILDDRDRIGVDLNRHVIQRLVAVGIGLQSLAAITAPQASRKRINDYVADIDATIKRMRTTIFDTATAHDSNPTRLRHRILAAVDDQTAALGCDVVTTFTGRLDRAISDTLAADAAAVVRETLASIAACAHATRVELRVDVGSDLITVAILDNGPDVATAARLEAAAAVHCRAETRAATPASLIPLEGGTQLVWTAAIPTETTR